MPEGSTFGIRYRRYHTLDRLVQRAFNALLFRPWFDDAALKLLTRWYFPLSRAWAAALAANGDPAAFSAAIPHRRLTGRMVPRLLDVIEMRRSALIVADEHWEEAFFGGGSPLHLIERARLRAAAALMQVRTSFTPLHVESPIPGVAFDVEPMASVERRHRRRLLQRKTAFQAERAPQPVETSGGYLSRRGIEGWVRFPAPTLAAGGWLSARVITPRENPTRLPSMIFAHGIGMEPEYWGDRRDACPGLVAAGLRLVRPEAPWHGRRRLPGKYGGEPILARGPGGLLDFLHTHVIELGQLVAWARATRGGPVAIGGISLGAITAQLAACAAHDWPEEMRPDALFLVAPSRSLADVAFEGSLTRSLGVPDAMRHAGWSVADVKPWLPLLEPTCPPALPPDRIIVVLGEADDVTLIEGGEALVRQWRVPEENIFRCPAGHFSTSIGLGRDAAPMRRLLQAMKGATG